MIRFKQKLEKKGLHPEEFLKQWSGIKEVGLREMGVQFHSVNLPRRFTWSGGRMLGYAIRNRKYTARKQREKGHYDPLKWSGESERLATTIQDVRVKVSGQKGEVRIVIHARGLNRRHKNSQIRMNDEVRRVSPREHGPLTRFLGRSIGKEMKARDKK